jgi:hypothetical protein
VEDWAEIRKLYRAEGWRSRRPRASTINPAGFRWYFGGSSLAIEARTWRRIPRCPRRRSLDGSGGSEG